MKLFRLMKALDKNTLVLVFESPRLYKTNFLIWLTYRTSLNVLS